MAQNAWYSCCKPLPHASRALLDAVRRLTLEVGAWAHWEVCPTQAPWGEHPFPLGDRPGDHVQAPPSSPTPQEVAQEGPCLSPHPARDPPATALHPRGSAQGLVT